MQSSGPLPAATPSKKTCSPRKTHSPDGIDKENQPWGKSGHLSLPGSQKLNGENQKSSPQQLPKLSSQKQCPQTPVNRIPLADLIGNTEDAFNYNPKDTTPEDRIYWQHGQNTRSPPKPTQSFSAASASQTHKSSRLELPATLDLKTLHESLKTPYNDPALDLWARYTDANMTKRDAEGKALPAFAHLMSSSPQTPGTTSSKDGLRRSISCGIEWPASKAKRRKLNSEMVEGRMRDIFAASKRDIMAADKSKASRISLLMEKLQENSVKAEQLETSGPSSSSPLPDCIGVPAAPDASPVPLRMASFQRDGRTSKKEEVGQAVGSEASQQENNADDDSSEFGDEDLVLDDLEAVEQSSTHLQTALPATETQRSVSHGGNNDRQDQTECRGTNMPTQDHQSTVVGSVQVDGADLEAASSSYGPFPDVEVEKEDDFGDDFVDGNDDSGAMADLATRFDDREISQQQMPNSAQHNLPSKNHHPVGRRATEASLHDDDPYNDGVGGDYDEELWNEVGDGSLLLDGGKATSSTSQKRSYNRAIKRYLIVDVAEGQYLNANRRQQCEKVLSIKDEKSGMLKVVLLRQAWFNSHCTKGSYVHLIGEFDHLGQCVVDDRENMIILHPDHLISATVVADSFSCTRRAVLQDRIKATGAAEAPQVYGHILHDVFGQALKDNDWSVNNLRRIIKKILSHWIEPLYEINTQVPQAVDYLMSKMPALQAWASIFVNGDAHPQGEVRDRNGSLSNMNVNKLLEVEEHIWSPLYGLKGNIDATIQVTLQEPNEPRTKTLTVPLEFKTGKKDNNEMHRAQTELYTLLLSDRYDVNVTCGVLYYLETSKTFRVQAIRNEIRHMVIQRNELAGYVRNKLELPPLVKKPFLCNTCYAKTACFTYHKLIDGGTGETSGLKDKFDEAVKHLLPVHQTFFRKWDELLTKEERDAMKFRRELWTMLSGEREALGRCFGQVYIEPGSAIEAADGPKINRHQYTLLKQAPGAPFSFTESQLTVGEPIVVSDEKGHFALANGYITQVRPDRLAVAVDRRLGQIRKKSAGFEPESNQVFKGIMDVADRGSSTGSTRSSSPKSEDTMLYRIDKDEFSNGMATVRNNLIRIMEKDLFKARELRELIIEGRRPSFTSSCPGYTLSGTSSQRGDLNVDQVNAIDKVLRAKDYALVLGMPGTGKTTTIAQIIRALVAQNKSVLLTSYTHTAVDNILLKIKDDGIAVLRLGAVAKVHPDVQSFADLGGVPKKTVAELEDSYVNSKVVASTCLGVNHPIFNTRIFDYCIVDEASQITLPTCLGPIRMAKTFILVGDHYQLPPLVQNKEAQRGGLDISLFKILSENQPDSVVNLEHQYRMAEDIMLLSNTLIYNGRLKCGTPTVANRMLSIPNLEAGLAAHHHRPDRLLSSSSPSTTRAFGAPTPTSICVQSLSTTCWLRHALNPPSRCVFLNTDYLPSPHDMTHGSRLTNPTEVTLTAQLVYTLLSSGVPGRTIGIITFYRSQLALLRQTFHTATAATTTTDHPEDHQRQVHDIEMHTADKFQGRDKDVVILSCVRSNHHDGQENNENKKNSSSNSNNDVGDLLRDWRRVNVAITRAKFKLLIIGSKATLSGSGNTTLKGLVDVMASKKGWMVDLPRDAGRGDHWLPADRVRGRGDKIASPITKEEDTIVPTGEKIEHVTHHHPSLVSSSPSSRSPLDPSSSSKKRKINNNNKTTTNDNDKINNTTTTRGNHHHHPHQKSRNPNKHFDASGPTALGSTSTSTSASVHPHDHKNHQQNRDINSDGSGGGGSKVIDKILGRNAVLRDVLHGV